MSTRFTYLAAPERAWQRKVRLAVETIDAVTLEPVWAGIAVKAEGMKAEPVISAGGRFVWFDENGTNPVAVSIDPGRLPYLARREIPPAPPPLPAAQISLLRVELAPTPAYVFAPGTSGVRGTLIDKRLDDPPVPLSSVPVNLQWINDDLVGTNWVNVPIISRTTAAGDFVAILRLAINQNARLDGQQRIRVRIAATHASLTQFSPELPIPPGYIVDVQPSFAWNEFQTV